MSSRMSESGAVLAAVKGKSLRDGLRPPLTAAPRSAPAKSGRDEEMSQARSNKEMQLTTPLTAIAPYKSIDVKRPLQIATWTSQLVKGFGRRPAARRRSGPGQASETLHHRRPLVTDGFGAFRPD